MVKHRDVCLLLFAFFLLLGPSVVCCDGGKQGVADKDAGFIDGGVDGEVDGFVDPSSDATVDISPGQWSSGDLDTYTQRHNGYHETQPEVEGTSAMITGTTSALAVRAGYEALLKDGSAADAALVTALTQITLVAGSYVSFAGILFAVCYDAEMQQVTYLNAGYNTPLEETDPMTIPAQGTGVPSGRTALVPGFPAGVAALHEQFGRLPFDVLFQPAIYFAENGFAINNMMAWMLQNKEDVLRRLPETEAVFTDENGNFYKLGDWFTQPVLAQTLREWASQGSEYMYTGTWGQDFVAAVQSEGGTITTTDMELYEPIWSDPLTTAIGVYDVYAPGLPSLGGVNTVEALNVLEAAGDTLTGSYTEDATVLFWMLQTARLYLLGHLDESTLDMIGGGLDLSPESRATKATAQALWEKMEAGELMFVAPPQTPPFMHSDSVVAVDKEGNICALTHTINTSAWGDTGIFVGGVSVPDSAGFQQSRMVMTGPGARLPEETNPTIVLKDGELVLASATIGITHYRLLPFLYNVTFKDTGMLTAFYAPEFLWPTINSFSSTGIVERLFEDQYPAHLIDELLEMGLWVDAVPFLDGQPYRGYLVGVERDLINDQLTGVTSKFSNGAVIGH